MNKTTHEAPGRMGDFNLPDSVTAFLLFSFFLGGEGRVWGGGRCCLSLLLPGRKLVAATLSAACLCIRRESDWGRFYPADKETLLITDVVSTKRPAAAAAIAIATATAAAAAAPAS